MSLYNETLKAVKNLSLHNKAKLAGEIYGIAMFCCDSCEKIHLENVGKISCHECGNIVCGNCSAMGKSISCVNCGKPFCIECGEEKMLNEMNCKECGYAESEEDNDPFEDSDANPLDKEMALCDICDKWFCEEEMGEENTCSKCCE
jgi:hypothetical protein